MTETRIINSLWNHLTLRAKSFRRQSMYYVVQEQGRLLFVTIIVGLAIITKLRTTSFLVINFLEDKSTKYKSTVRSLQNLLPYLSLSVHNEIVKLMCQFLPVNCPFLCIPKMISICSKLFFFIIGNSSYIECSIHAHFLH